MIRYVWNALRRCLRERRLPSLLKNGYPQIYGVWGEHQLRRRGYVAALDRRPSTALGVNFADQWFLYRLARKRRPRVALEFGSGSSTIFLAYALRDNQLGVLYSIESDAHWAGVTEQTLPGELREIVTISASRLGQLELFGVPGWRHIDMPDVVPDLVYLDGPPLSAERRVAFDLLDLESRLRPGFVMVVDGREANVEFLRKHFQRRWRITERRAFKNTVFDLIE